MKKFSTKGRGRQQQKKPSGHVLGLWMSIFCVYDPFQQLRFIDLHAAFFNSLLGTNMAGKRLWQEVTSTSLSSQHLLPFVAPAPSPERNRWEARLGQDAPHQAQSLTMVVITGAQIWGPSLPAVNPRQA